MAGDQSWQGYRGESPPEPLAKPPPQAPTSAATLPDGGGGGRADRGPRSHELAGVTPALPEHPNPRSISGPISYQTSPTRAGLHLVSVCLCRPECEHVSSGPVILKVQ